MKCPCHSNQLYEECCKPYHEGRSLKSALLLMRARYAAYALGLADFIIETTHPDNPSYTEDKKEWKREILLFSEKSEFYNLKILDFSESRNRATVTFTAYIRQGDKEATFTEKSSFEKVDGRWLYVKGTIR